MQITLFKALKSIRISDEQAIEVVNAVEEYIGLSLRQHPLAFLRADLTRTKHISCEELQRTKDGRYITIAGLVLVRQRPGSAKGVMFITIEDEGANANLIIWPKLFEESRRIVMGSRLLGV